MFANHRLLLFSGARAIGANALLVGEAQGLGIDFSFAGGLGSVTVKDTTTPANNLSNAPVDSFLTQSGTSPKLVLWSDGLYRWTNHNLITKSQEFANARWIKQTNVTATDNAVAAPNGTLTGAQIDWGSAANNAGIFNTGGGSGGYTDIRGVWVRADAAGGTVGLVDPNSGAGETIATLTTAWQLVTLSQISTVGQPTGVFIRKKADSPSRIYLAAAQANYGSALSVYHVTPTTSPWYGVPIEYDPVGAAASPPKPFYVLVEPQATNLALQASDFTNASWTKSNLTAALTATGPDGVANSASTLTATAGNATALQAITSASASRVTSAFIKRRTGSGEIDLTQDNGGTWTSVAVTSSWTRLPIAAVTSANPTVGIRIVVNGDAVDVAWFQHETSPAGTTAVATSPIPTFAATVTRSGDLINAATTSFPYSTTAGTFYAQAALLLTPASVAGWAGVGANTRLIYFVNTRVPQIFDGTNFASGSAVTLGTSAQITTSFGGLGLRLTQDGGAVQTGTFAGSMASGTFYVGAYDNTGSTTAVARIYKLVMVPRQVADASLPTWKYAA